MDDQHLIIVERIDGRWTIGHLNRPFQAFRSKREAIERARLVADRIGADARVLVIEQLEARSEGPPRRQERRGPARAASSRTSRLRRRA